MILKLIDRKIRQAFSSAALHYDVLTSLHREIGRELIKKVKLSQDTVTILDVGMGTGWLTRKIAFFYPGSLIVGLDFAPGMVNFALEEGEGFKILQADARALPFKGETFEAVVSNLAYQWMEDLPQAFGVCRQILKPSGILCLTMFGRETLAELFVALEKSLEEKEAAQVLPIRRLASQTEIEAALDQAGFKDVQVKSERVKVRFPDMVALIKWTKDIGANQLEKNIYIGKELLNRANQYYDEHYKDHWGIYTTFEVIWISARK